MAREDHNISMMSLPISEINPSDPDIFYKNIQNKIFDKLRLEKPIHYCAESPFGSFWSITKYADIVDIENRPSEFSSINGFTIADLPLDTTFRSFASMDPPHHRIIRQAVTPIASLSSLNELKLSISNLIASTLDKLPINNQFDFVNEVSIEITIKVLALMLGIPFDRCHDLLKWSEIASTVPGSEKDINSFEDYDFHLKECAAYFYGEYLRQASNEPSPTILSMFANSEHTKNLQFEEIFLNILLLLLAGNDTTRHSISGGALFFDLYKDQRELFYNKPEFLLSGISEIIRFQTPISHMRRTVTADIEFRGHKFKKGDKVILWYTAGNRDSDEIKDPDSFIVNRKNHDHHLAFGSGVHKCIGKNIAILQMRLFWEEIIKRRLIIKVISPPDRIRSNIINGYSGLMVELHRY